MKLELLEEGDEVLNVTAEFVAVKRMSGEVDIIPLKKEEGRWSVDIENIVTIGYGANTVIYENESGVKIFSF